MSNVFDASRWVLRRATQDEMGLNYIEGEDHFQPDKANCHVIGVEFTHLGSTGVRVILEGEKEILEEVLEWRDKIAEL